MAISQRTNAWSPQKAKDLVFEPLGPDGTSIPDPWLQSWEGVRSALLLQGPKSWSVVWRPRGTKTAQFLFWKLPRLTSSLWLSATLSSSAEKSLLRAARGATTGQKLLQERGGEQRKDKVLLRGPCEHVFSYEPS